MPRRIVLGLAVLLAACKPSAGPTQVPDAGPAEPDKSALELSDELEALIEYGKDTEDQRVGALEKVRAMTDDGSAAYAFARAALAGRVAELRGIKAGKLVGEAESFARSSIERDPEFRDRAASRMLGLLWVKAPPRLVEHGDSEEGLSVLEELVEQKPDDVINHLRLAEAYIFLGDPEPAVPYLCTAQAGRESLRRDDDALLTKLLEEAAEEEAIQCEAAAPQP